MLCGKRRRSSDSLPACHGQSRAEARETYRAPSVRGRSFLVFACAEARRSW